MDSDLVMDACPLCGSIRKKNLYSHLFFVHSYTKQQIEDFKEERRRERLALCGTTSNCKVCGVQLPSKRAVERHVRAEHPEKYLENWPHIWCPICHEILKSHYALVDHAQANHSETADQYKIEVVNFPNMEEFEKWKRISEEHDMTSRAITSSKQRKGSRVMYMRCHRAQNRCRRLKDSSRKGTRKVVPFCTAFMKVIESESGVRVEYCSTHFGHDVQPELLRLDKQSEQYIVSLLRKGLKCREVYETVKEKAATQTNIAKKYSLRPVDIRRGKGVYVSDNESEEEECDQSDAMEVDSETVVADPEPSEPEPVASHPVEPEQEPEVAPSTEMEQGLVDAHPAQPEPEPMVLHPEQSRPEPMGVIPEQPEPGPSAAPSEPPESEPVVAHSQQPESVATQSEQPKQEPDDAEPESVTEKLLSEFTVTSERPQQEILVQTTQPESDFLHAESLLPQEQSSFPSGFTKRLITAESDLKEIKQEADEEKPPINYEMANMEVLGRIEKIKQHLAKERTRKN
ncbi:zinc finger, C2H2 type [Ancylostoma caninum]|uniref:Zinc finger, C2H2 type n=1 Tax=Ancylostoma caninum TaxID=29170 RepID=A0A368H0D9_ANCCA|nr:zinc finger, C2H2 type [Ancylostoma caninum]